ncbi:hypothetical protein QQF64_001805 [Cirrhinus molitorella]|uniref:Uncharacterized protein n=1 Tax=Cirrhinus molitorella TaxID=172907 RepID=A0ABR3MNC1_9TELE
MSLPARTDLLSLELLAKPRCMNTSGSPFATNKPIDIKARRRCRAQAGNVFISSLITFALKRLIEPDQVRDARYRKTY